MRKPAKIVSLASALAALASSAGSGVEPPIAGTADAHLVSDPTAGMQSDVEPTQPSRVELMSFTVVKTSDGEMFPQHGSHVSHASHVSGGIPSMPDMPSWPSLPSSTGGGSATSPAPAPAADPIATACARANAGYGVKDIVAELEQSFSLSAGNAQSIAKQALDASLNNGSYCAGQGG